MCLGGSRLPLTDVAGSVVAVPANPSEQSEMDCMQVATDRCYCLLSQFPLYSQHLAVLELIIQQINEKRRRMQRKAAVSG